MAGGSSNRGGATAAAKPSAGVAAAALKSINSTGPADAHANQSNKQAPAGAAMPAPGSAPLHLGQSSRPAPEGQQTAQQPIRRVSWTTSHALTAPMWAGAVLWQLHGTAVLPPPLPPPAGRHACASRHATHVVRFERVQRAEQVGGEHEHDVGCHLRTAACTSSVSSLDSAAGVANTAAAEQA